MSDPKPPPKHCDRPGCQFPRVPGFRFCRVCVSQVRKEMESAGYFTKAPATDWDDDEKAEEGEQ